MASSLIRNTNQVYFASVLAMENAGMVAMFEALEASGLNGFLGCLSDIYEASLVELFQNDSVRDGQVISTVQGKLVEISEEVFARTFELPVEGLMDLNEVPKDLVFYARIVFSFNGEQLSTSCKKREMKFDFRLLCDILEKSITVKVGSFDENLELGDSKEFPPIKILTAKTVGRYIAINENIGVEEVEDESRVKKTPVKKVASRKRPAAAVDEPVVKKKRTRVGKAAVVAKDSALLKRKEPKRKLKLPQGSEDEPVAKDADVGDVEKQSDEPTADEVDNIIAQVVTETAQMDIDIEELVGSRADTIPEIGETVVVGTVVGEPMIQRSDETEDRIDIFSEFSALDFPVFTSETDRLFETGSESEDELELSMSKQPSQISESENRDVESALAAYLVEELIEETEQNQGTEIADAVPTADAKISDDESMNFEEHLSMIPDGSSLPSTIGEVTKIQFGKSITIRGVDEGDWYKASVPKIPAAAKGKAPLQEKDPIKWNPAKEIFSLICADIELLVQLREKVIDDVDKFFNSFSFKRLDALKIEDIYANEEQVFTWAEIDSTRIALQRRMYTLTKYRELLLRKFLEARKTNFVPELKTEMQAHGLIWEMTCCSRLFEGLNRDCGAVIARSNENIRSSCWIRTMIRVDGFWAIEPCADYWKPLPRRIIRNEILPQIAYVDTLPPVSDFFKLFKKRWADVCIEAVEFFMIGKLLLVGSLNFCRALTVVKPAQQFDSRRPTVTTWGCSQLWTTFLRFSLFGGLQTVHFSILRSAVVSVRPVFGASSIFDTVVQLAPVPSLSDTAFDYDVQMDAIQSSDSDSDSSSSHDLMDIHVDTPVIFTTADALQGTDTVVDQPLLISTDPTAIVFTESFAQLRDSISQISIKQKGTRAHRALVTTELEDILKEVKAMDEQLATIRSEMVDFRGSRGSGGDGSSQIRYRGGSSKKRLFSSSGGVHHSSGGGGPVGPIIRDAEYWIYGKRPF
ncbi:hypothetical protein F511_11547 [Dorcoceras hygrometricum]|uniref:Splicing factor 3B subunit 1-like n=1 Tax=Dorcoceras hygrometricum TaxID=472368 RepID=A0A2Z7ABW0_9LAMI|nr:hypothetical protein F511_11547 [Dorcoceras hygrometricum]